jgi:tRNA dimethylallyltransferase
MVNGVVILGATATGKTALGVHVARAFDGEIISADSRQVYRGLDLGSGKDLAEYGDIPYHLIDIIDLSREYSVYDFQKDWIRVSDEIAARGKLPVTVGGTGMYIDSVVRGYSLASVPANERLRAELESLSLDELVKRLLTLKSEVHNRTDLVERPRLVRAIEIAEYERDKRDGLSHGPSGETSCDVAQNSTRKPLVIGVRFERSILRQRIRTRLEQRLDAGLVDEVRALHAAGASWERLERLGLEYRFTAEYIQGKIATLGEYTESLYTAICQFAKRQETWFRGMERKGVSIEWIDRGDRDDVAQAVKRFLRQA